MRDYDAVPLLKLHGCITRTHDEGCPLILSSEQYIHFEVGRNRLFRLFKELAAEKPICYVGFSNNDPHIRSLVQQLDAEKVGRPHSFLISPSVDNITMRYWSLRHITAIQGTMEDLTRELDARIGKTFRGLRRSTPTGALAITERFASSSNVLSDPCVKSLENDLDYVKGVVPEATCDAVKFYSGVNQGWVAIEQSLDVRRRLHDTLLEEYFLEDNPRKHRFLVVKAHAGAGKSVFLRRLAWEAAKDIDRLCLYATADATLSSASINEIINATKEHVYLFVDDVLRHRPELEAFISGMGSAIEKLTIIGGARTNEWNVTPPAFQALVTDEHFLPYLSDKELDSLIEKLEQHKALKELERLTQEERREQLRKKASRQLLVALHEATSGKRFEEILHDEYSRLAPNRAKTVYLAICFLNQFGVPVRAGLIARRFGITFEEFRNSLFKPLEDVVVTIASRNGGDHCYAARHSHVAEIVVRNELAEVEDLFNEYLEAITNLNIGYSTDKQVFRNLANGKRLANTFPDAIMGYRVFEIASEAMNEEDPYLLQQQALFEMNRLSGNLGKATDCLSRALELAPKSRIINHTLAELHLRKSDSARTDLEKEHSLRNAESICRGLRRDASDSYAHSTIVKAGIQRLRRIVESDKALATEDVEGVIKGIETSLEEGLQRFPGDSFLLAQEAELAKLLCESERVMKSLRLSFDKNPRNAHVALQLASIAEEKSDLADAQRVLRTALEANGNNQRLHFAYGKFLLRNDIGSVEDQVYHFRHSFTPGDQNYEAQLMFGRQLFVANRFEDSKDVFGELRSARLPNSVRRRQSLPLKEYFIGTVVRNEAWFCLIERDGDRAQIRFDQDDSGETDWTEIARYTKVRFRIAFTMYGPEAFDVTVN
jgi:cytochrome c-type biogenesis protein CcmH/NrfG